MLATAAVEATPTNFAVRLAASRFRDQVQKAGLDLACVPEARLLITRSPTARGGQVNGHARAGYEVKFVAMARSDRGRTFERRSPCSWRLMIPRWRDAPLVRLIKHAASSSTEPVSF